MALLRPNQVLTGLTLHQHMANVTNILFLGRERGKKEHCAHSGEVPLIVPAQFSAVSV